VPSNSRPQPSENSVSPQSSTSSPAKLNATWPRVWPGVSITCARLRPNSTVAPGRTAMSSGGSRRASASLPTTLPPNSAFNASTPPTWSPWWWVSRMRSSRPPPSRTAAAAGPASPGSQTATAPEASSRNNQM
jgi:hypothetical protein